MIVFVQIKAVKIYIAAVEAVKKKKRQAETQHLVHKVRD